MLLTVESEIKFTQDTAFHLTKEDVENIKRIHLLFNKNNRYMIVVSKETLDSIRIIDYNYWAQCSVRWDSLKSMQNNEVKLMDDNLITINAFLIKELDKIIKLKAFYEFFK